MRSRFLLLLALSISFLVPARAQLDLTSATIADIQAAFAKGTLTSEKLVQFYLARIAAYDKQGPNINSVILLNPQALELARTMDAERKAGKIRGPLHGIPIALKDNYDTFDMVTTGGSQLLKGSIPPDDAFTVKKIREAGAIIIAKLNLSEFASGGGAPNGFSSMGGQTRNPHDLTKGPAGSSGGTGAAIAAAFAQAGTGSDTGGSIRGPSSANGIVGLKTTMGLLSRDGIIPLALSRDTAGPMARSVYDVAVLLGAMTGIDPADPTTKASAGRAFKDYTKFLERGALKGARLGISRDYMGQDAEVDRVMEAAFAKLRELGATLVDFKYPTAFMQARSTGGAGRGGAAGGPAAAATPGALAAPSTSGTEFSAQIADYLSTLKPGYPRTLAELVAKAEDPATGYTSPWKAASMRRTMENAGPLDDPLFKVSINETFDLTRAYVLAVMEKYSLDAIVYPTSPLPAREIGPGTFPDAPGGGGGGGGTSPSGIANQTGFPDMIVPAGMTKDGLPVTISFLGRAFSEPQILAYGYDFEQATHARVLPKTTPPLAAPLAASQ